MKSILFLGRQPQIGIAELESVFGAEAITPLSDTMVGCSIEASAIPFSRLGGSIKCCDVIGTQDGTNWRTVEKILHQLIPGQMQQLSGEGKLHFGLSAYGANVSADKVQATALQLKKLIRSRTGQSIRIVPNKSPALSTAQIIHHKLITDQGLEIVIIQHDDRLIVAKTVAEQDIEAYTKRDQNRPKRDARVGMLPPKLAQIIINLATQTSNEKLTVLDPFCGTGVVLQEAALMGHNIYGSDIEPRMIEYSHENLTWLNQTHKLPATDVTLEVGDATNHTWTWENTAPAALSIACEGYLGQPFSAFPSEEKLREVTQTCNQIMKGFLKNIADQIESDTQLCVALPAWHRPSGQFVHLKLLDSLDELGYNRVSFVHVRTEDLLYYRPDQVVARELLVITRK